MNELKVFENPEFGNVRTLNNGDKILFCASDVAKSLGYAIPTKAVNTHCKGVSKMEVPTDGGTQQMLFIQEGDIYRLVIRSKLPAAEKFEHWVFDEVLPSIRKHGTYMSDEIIEKTLSDPDYLIKLATAIKTEKKARIAAEQQRDEFKKKAVIDDMLSASSNSILIGELAKILCQNGHKIGRDRMFEWLRENGYLIKSGNERNLPIQRYLEQKLFEVQTTVLSIPGKEPITKSTTKVTGKGVSYFLKLFSENNYGVKDEN